LTSDNETSFIRDFRTARAIFQPPIFNGSTVSRQASEGKGQNRDNVISPVFVSETPVTLGALLTGERRCISV
jgi:hypothetical protein